MKAERFRVDRKWGVFQNKNRVGPAYDFRTEAERAKANLGTYFTNLKVRETQNP